MSSMELNDLFPIYFTLHIRFITFVLYFRYGQLSGMVEPVAGLLGAVTLSYAQPLLPYALAFAAGAMIYVVFDDIVPEAHSRLVGQL